jgi:hypothetical protein
LGVEDRPRVLLLAAEARLASGDTAGTVSDARAAVAAARAQSQRDLVADGLVLLGTSLQAQGDLESALRAAVEAHALYSEVGDGCGAARAALLKSVVAAASGNTAGAEAALDEAARLAERTRVTRLIRQVGERRTELETTGTFRSGPRT